MGFSLDTVLEHRAVSWLAYAACADDRGFLQRAYDVRPTPRQGVTDLRNDQGVRGKETLGEPAILEIQTSPCLMMDYLQLRNFLNDFLTCLTVSFGHERSFTTSVSRSDVGHSFPSRQFLFLVLSDRLRKTT